MKSVNWLPVALVAVALATLACNDGHKCAQDSSAPCPESAQSIMLGTIKDAATGAPVSGIRVELANIDSLTAAGHAVRFSSDTSVVTGRFTASLELLSSNTFCTDQRGFTSMLRFVDTRSRYQPTVQAVQNCLRSQDDVARIQNIEILMLR
jgi:hypothetical protein